MALTKEDILLKKTLSVALSFALAAVSVAPLAASARMDRQERAERITSHIQRARARMERAREHGHDRRAERIHNRIIRMRQRRAHLRERGMSAAKANHR